MLLSEDRFRELLEKTHLVVVADFFATWCGPCKRFAPIFERSAKGFEGQVEFAMIDVDNADQLCEDLAITSVPTIVVFKNGQVVDKHVGGFASEQELTKFIKDSI
jgi:thioredoxin 1